MEFLNVFLAGLFDKFKQKNPAAWMLTSVVLIAVLAGLEAAKDTYDDLPGWTFTALQILNAVALAFNNSRSTQILSEAEAKKADAGK